MVSKRLIVGSVLTLALANTFAGVRPLIARAGSECTTAYLQAMKPTTEEASWLADLTLGRTIEAIRDMEQRQDTIYLTKKQVESGKEVQSNYLLVAAAQRAGIGLAQEKRDKCWAVFAALTLTESDLNNALLSTASSIPDYRDAPVLALKLIKRGANVDGKMTIKELSWQEVKVGALFPVLIEGVVKSWRSYGTHVHLNDAQAQSARDFVRLLISNMKQPSTLNSRSPARKNALGTHSLVYAAEKGDDVVLNVLLDAGADPAVRSPGGNGYNAETLIDLYAGKDVNTIKRLTGIAIKFNKPQLPGVGDWDSLDDGVPTQQPANSGRATAPVNVATTSSGMVPPALVASYMGIATSTMQPNQPISGSGYVNARGEFGFKGTNGVTIRGTLDASGAQIVGKGKTQLPEGPNGQKYTYPNGATQADGSLTGTFDGQLFSGSFVSKFETVKFALCVESAVNNPACTSTVANPVGDLLQGLGGLLGVRK